MLEDLCYILTCTAIILIIVLITLFLGLGTWLLINTINRGLTDYVRRQPELPIYNMPPMVMPIQQQPTTKPAEPEQAEKAPSEASGSSESSKKKKKGKKEAKEGDA